jgi:hypothetical protein
MDSITCGAAFRPPVIHTVLARAAHFGAVVAQHSGAHLSAAGTALMEGIGPSVFGPSWCGAVRTRVGFLFQSFPTEAAHFQSRRLEAVHAKKAPLKT